MKSNKFIIGIMVLFLVVVAAGQTVVRINTPISASPDGQAIFYRSDYPLQVAARPDAVLELQSLDGPQLSLLATTCPAIPNQTETSIAGSIVDSVGQEQKILSFSAQCMDCGHAHLVSRVRLYGTYDNGLTDDAINIYGNHGIDLFGHVGTVAATPGAGVLRVYGKIKPLEGIEMVSPNGTCFLKTVDNDGNWVTTACP